MITFINYPDYNFWTGISITTGSDNTAANTRGSHPIQSHLSDLVTQRSGRKSRFHWVCNQYSPSTPGASWQEPVLYWQELWRSHYGLGQNIRYSSDRKGSHSFRCGFSPSQDLWLNDPSIWLLSRYLAKVQKCWRIQQQNVSAFQRTRMGTWQTKTWPYKRRSRAWPESAQVQLRSIRSILETGVYRSSRLVCCARILPSGGPPLNCEFFLRHKEKIPIVTNFNSNFAALLTHERTDWNALHNIFVDFIWNYSRQQVCLNS